MHILKTTVLFLLCSWFVISAEAVCRPGKICPSKCSCTSLPSSDNMMVNCSSRGLDQLPILPSNTEMFVMRNNNLTSLPDNAFEECSSLLYLDLSSNLLKDVGEKAFAGVEQLESLLLNNNSIDMNTLSASLLQNLTHLSRLLIHDNNVSEQVITYNDQLFAPLMTLQTMILDGLPNATFGPGFSGLHHLEYLRVVGKLQYITNDTFKHLNNSALKTFVVRSGVLTDVDQMAFGHFRHLETLDLSFNPLLGFPNVSNAWYGMQFTNISSIYLKRSVPYNYQIITVDIHFLKHLEHTKLKRLVLDANNIVTIDAGFFIYTPYLEHLSVAYNRLVQIFFFMIDMFLMSNLKVLDASFQSRRSITPTDHDMTSEMILDSHMSRDIGDQTFQKSLAMILRRPQSTIELHLPQNGRGVSTKVAEVDVLLRTALERFNKTWPLPDGAMYLLFPPGLHLFECAACLTIENDALHQITVITGAQFEILNFSLNSVREFWGPLIIIPPQKKITVDFSWNDCSFVHPDLAKQCGSYLGTLYLGKNNLGQQLAEDNNATFFRHFTELIKLDLSSNNIKSLHHNTFKYPTKVHELNLRDNSLRVINFNLTLMTNLSFLDVSANLLDQLGYSTRTAMDLLASKNNFTVDLTDNPLQCSCETLAFLNWIPQSKVHLRKWDQYVCVYNEQPTDLGQLQKILAELNVNCHSKTWVIVTAAVLVVVCVLLAVIYVMHRHRFEIRYWCLRFVVHRRRYEALMDEYKEYEYDAFVAFEKRDIAWVDEHLIPALDSQNGQGEFHLLIHHRDFLPGRDILESIYEGIEKSRKIILVISQYFVESNYCKYELENARLHGLEEGTDNLIAILLREDFDLLTTPNTLRELLRKKTYLKWPEDPNEMQHFWLNLSKTLATKQTRPQNNDIDC